MTTPEPSIRVRFAPSPTGFLHVGGARTAIFNYLWARHNGGTFVLRIEDTDVERSTLESEESLKEDLRWLGLDWDEGPVKGGDYGPYRQSERTGLYKEIAARFVGSGVAYPCFCSDEALERKREAAQASGRPPQYDGTCLGLPNDEVAAKRAERIPEVVRFHVEEGAVTFDDVVRGDMRLETSMVGDFVIMRSNGLPTYNFAAAVDDHHMKITHVIRGEEHLSNTLRQALIYGALGADMPIFAHVPLILAEDRSKLSKRHGGASVEELRTLGYLPDALFNYLLLLGWSHPDGEEILTREQTIEVFDIDRIGKAAGVFDKTKLLWMNGQYIRAMPAERLLELAGTYIPAWLTERYDESKRLDIIAVVQESIETLAGVADACSIFADDIEPDEEATELLKTPDAREVLAAFAERLSALEGELSPESFKALVKETGKETGRKGKELFFPLRAAITGSVHGPDLSRVASIKGRESVNRALHGS